MYLVKRVMVPETRWHIAFLSEEAEWAGAFILCLLAVPLDLLSPTERAVRFTEGNTAAVVSEAKSPIQSRALNSVSFSLSFFFSSHEGSWSPQSGIEARRPALGAQSSEHWMARAVPSSLSETLPSHTSPLCCWHQQEMLLLARKCGTGWGQVLTRSHSTCHSRLPPLRPLAVSQPLIMPSWGQVYFLGGGQKSLRDPKGMEAMEPGRGTAVSKARWPPL